MKKILCIAVPAVIVIALSVLGFILNPPLLNDEQESTLVILFIICGVSALYCFVIGEITRNTSQMDKLWSILPIVYLWVIAAKSGFELRLILMALLVTFWGVRLTINFAKKGAYSIKFWEGEEDYRWAVLRSTKPFDNKLIWAIFNLGFISVYQNVLVLLICLPALSVMNAGDAINYYDIIPALLTLGFIILETIADKEQMDFYNKRKELMKDGTPLKNIAAPYNKGFNTLGLWHYSRHPNYLSEQAIWICLYFFTISAGETRYFLFNWSMVGCMLLILLFLGSSTMSESISSSKYPMYKEYMKTTSKYIPLPNKKVSR